MPSNSLTLSLRSTLLASVYSPVSLFYSGEQGQLMQVDPAYLYTDTAGTTLVSATGQAVALWKDQSGRNNNDTQATVGSRPIYGKHPANGYRNRLASSEDFSAAVWIKANATVTANAAVAPDGTLTADSISWVSGGGIYMQQNTNTSAGQVVNFSVWVRAASGTQTFRLYGDNTIASSDMVATASWQRFSFSYTVAVDGSARGCGITNPTIPTSFSGFIWGAQLETGSTATTYQRTGASSGVAWPAPPSYDITEAGQSDLHYLHYNGVSSFMVSPTITPGIDKAQVFVGVRKLSDSTSGHIVGGNGNTSGEFEIVSGGWTVAANRYGAGFYTDNRAQIDSQPNFAPPRTDVLSWRFDTSGATAPDKAKLNVNAVAQTLSIVGLPSAANFSAFVNYTGRRGGTSLPFNGLIYSKIIRFGANLTSGQIASTERWTGQRTGVSV